MITTILFLQHHILAYILYPEQAWIPFFMRECRYLRSKDSEHEVKLCTDSELHASFKAPSSFK